MKSMFLTIIFVVLMPSLSFSGEVARTENWYVTHEDDPNLGHRLSFYNSKTNQILFNYFGETPVEMYLETKTVKLGGHSLAVTKWANRNGEALIIFEPFVSVDPYKAIWSMESIEYNVQNDFIDITYKHEKSEADPTMLTSHKYWRPKAKREPKSVTKAYSKAKTQKTK